MPTISSKKFHKLLQPAQAWVAILGLIAFITVLFIVHAGRYLVFIYPVSFFLLAIYLYFRAPFLYTGFTLWITFLAPFIRRIIDYQSGYLTPGPWNLAASLVTSVSVFTLIRYLPKSTKFGGMPFLLSASSVIYGFFIAIVHGEIGIDKSFVILLGWLGPICFGFHLFFDWRNYPSHRQIIQRTFLWGVLIMGVYGIVQFLVVPPWDRFFLIEYEGLTSAGKPVPLGVHVWSTMGSPGTFASTLRAGLLLLLISKEILFIPSSVVGYLSFLLTTKRTAWASWFLGLLIFLSSSKAKHQMRIVVMLVAMLLFLVPLVSMEFFSDNISSRFETFLNLGNDPSASARQERYGDLLGPALTSFLGKGIGAKVFELPGGLPFESSLDSAVLAMLLQFGWFGTIFYTSGLLLALFSLLQGSENKFDPFLNTARAITLGGFAQIAFSMPFFGEEGTIFWGFIGIAMAGRKYCSYNLKHKSLQYEFS